ncbi:MAG: hypothetical protein RIC55_08000 [Pirellulaceae bacterium]
MEAKHGKPVVAELADDADDLFPPPKRFPSRTLIAGTILLGVFATLVATDVMGTDGILESSLMWIGGGCALGGGACLFFATVQAVRFVWGQFRTANRAK